MSDVLIRLVIALGAWLSAILFTAAAGVFVVGVLEIDDPFALVLAGGIYMAVGLPLANRNEEFSFAGQLGLAVTISGLLLFVAGLGIESEELWVTTLASAIAVPILSKLARSSVIQLLSSFIAVAFYATLAFAEHREIAGIMLAVLGPAGLWLYAYRRAFAPAAIILLLAFPCVALFASFDWGGSAVTPWAVKAVYVALSLALAMWYRAHSTTEPRVFFGVVLVAIAVTLVLPPGGTAALALMVLAFVSGSPVIAAFAVPLQTAAIIRFYYDLDMTLLVKSGLFVAVGALLLLAWYALRREVHS